MGKIIFTVLYLLTFLVTERAFSQQLAFEKSTYGWLAAGDFRGNFEPCGCDPATDLGGIKRLATFLKHERTLFPQSWFFVLGNIVSVRPQALDLASQFLVEGLAQLQPTATLLNISELIHKDEILKTSYVSPLNFVASNLKDQRKFAGVNEVIKQPGVTILGYTYNKDYAKLSQKISPQLISRWRNILKSEQSSYKILLFSGDNFDLKTIIRAKLFTSIISASARYLNTEVGKEESENPRLLIRHADDMVVEAVPVGGQGVLRGGALRFNKAPSIEEIFSNGNNCTNCSKPSHRSLKREQTIEVSWLDKSYEIDSPLQAFYERYNLEKQKQFLTQAQQRKRLLQNSPFAGSQACMQCHHKAYEVWKKSKHAEAFKVLVDKNKDKDADCVKCHVLGFDHAGGFVSLEESPQFANVQCEVCHGPRAEHIKNPAIKPKGFDKKQLKHSCRQCHHGSHSPNFEYSKYWSKIRHD